MNTTLETGDEELVARSLGGDRDAFGQIVARYQILICSLAYSRIGHLGQSEDVAQETFITAWKHLRLLREPAKLRSWLCGILRNRANKCLERERRQPANQAEPLESAAEAATAEELPSEQTIGREEEAILWRSLEKIPELYREPLVLYYREHQSIEQVAAELELSEDAVKQRLSRGRKMLQDEVMSFVEKTLQRSAPRKQFSNAVMQALPMTGSGAGAGAAGKGAAMAKSGAIWPFIGPIIAMAGGILAHWLIWRAAPTARERRLKKIGFISMWAFILAWCVGGQLALFRLSAAQGWGDNTLYGVMAGFWWIYAMVIATLAIVMFRRILAIRREEKMEPGELRKPDLLMGGKLAVVSGGVYLACFYWIIELAWRADDELSASLTVAFMVVLAGWNFSRLRGRAGVDAMRRVAQNLALVWAVILVILNMRLETWLAFLRGTNLGEVHTLLPAPVIPLLTVALLVWAGLVMIVTRPKVEGTPAN